MVLFRWSKSGQNRQSPGSMRPWYVRQPHQAYPAQTGGLDHVGIAGADSVPVDTQSTDASATAALDRLVYTEHHRLITLTEMLDQKQQLKGREDRAVEDVVVLCEPVIAAESHYTERRCDGPFAWTEYGSEEQ